MYKVIIGTTEVPAKNIKIENELNKVFVASFDVPNDDERRKLVAHDVNVEIKYAEVSKFLGKLDNFKYGAQIIDCRARDKICVLERTYYSKDQGQEDVRNVLWRTTAANTILNDILSGTGWTGVCPTTVVSIRFEHISRLKAIENLAHALGKDLWRSGSTEVTIGDKGVDRGAFENVTLLDKDEESKKIKNKIYVIGRSLEGLTITVTVEDSGSQTAYGLRELTRIEREAADSATLTLIGNKILQERKNPVTQIPMISTVVDVVEKSLEVGDSVTLTDERKSLSGSYRIYKMTYAEEKVDLDVASVAPIAATKVADLVNVEVAEQRRRVLIGEGVPEFGATSYTGQRVIETGGESEDGWIIGLGQPTYMTYEISKDYFKLEHLTGCVGESVIRPDKKVGRLDKSPSFQAEVVYTPGDAQSTTNFYALLRYVNYLWGKYFGFDFWRNTVKGICHDGTSITTIDLKTDYVAGTKIRLKAVYVTNKKVDFYIDDVYKGTITTNLPGTEVAWTICMAARQSYTGGSPGTFECMSYISTEKW